MSASTTLRARPAPRLSPSLPDPALARAFAGDVKPLGSIPESVLITQRLRAEFAS